MSRRIRVKPSKPASLFGSIVGIIFICIGIFVAIPIFGIFGVLWTLIAVAITGSQAYNFFSEKGVTSWEIDIDHGIDGESINDDFETRLRKLNSLKEDGLITEEEFQKKREEILGEKW